MSTETTQEDRRKIGDAWTPITGCQLKDSLMVALGWSFYDGWIKPDGSYPEAESDFPDLDALVVVAKEYAEFAKAEPATPDPLADHPQLPL